MDTRIRIGIAGYGNLGRGVESALAQNPDMQLVGVFTRRNPEALEVLGDEVPVYRLDTIAEFTDRIDVLILCGGSRSDLPEQGPRLAALFNTVDSFDTHPRIPEYFEAIDRSARPKGKVAIISIGWDPGMFSINRLIGEALLPQGATYTFWGKGLSQGHSDALRRVPGVKGAVQYTVPVPEAVERVRQGLLPELSTRQKHTRECHVVLDEGANPAEVERAIVTMPDYFADYDTSVHFIDEDELRRNHSAMPHGGFVIRSGTTGSGAIGRMPGSNEAASGHTQVIEYSLKLDSNPEFTASVLVAYARAAHRLARQGESGAKTAFDIAPGLLSPKSAAQLRKELL